MDVNKILNIVHQADPEVFDKISPRRHILKSFTSKVAVASLPFALGAFFKKAYGQTTDALYEALLTVLRFENMEAEFYRTATTVVQGFPAEIHGPIGKLADDERRHAKFLSDVAIGLVGSAPPVPNYDFSGGRGTGKGPFEQVFGMYTEFLKLAQVFEDTAVRAYKGQLPRMQSNSDFVKWALKIHSVEARHAAFIRLQRRKYGVELKPWVTFDNSNIDTQQNNFIQHSYKGETLAVQGDRQLVNVNGYSVTEAQVTEAFDEPLNEADLILIMEPYVVNP